MLPDQLALHKGTWNKTDGTPRTTESPNCPQGAKRVTQFKSSPTSSPGTLPFCMSNPSAIIDLQGVTFVVMTRLVLSLTQRTRGGTRTRMAPPGPGGLSPLRLPFRHPGKLVNKSRLLCCKQIHFAALFISDPSIGEPSTLKDRNTCLVLNKKYSSLLGTPNRRSQKISRVDGGNETG